MKDHLKARALVFTCAALAALAARAPASRADDILFDPDGGGPNPTMTIGGLDWAVGNVLSHGALPLTPNGTFQTYYQATLAGFIDTNGKTITVPGLNGASGAPAFQITAVVSLTEIVSSVSSNPGSATFALAPVQAANSFIEIYYNSSVVANNLAGTGFNAGTLIYAGHPTAALPNSANFTLAGTVDTFDQFGSNYPGIQSVVGTGSNMLGGLTDGVNTDFFKQFVGQIQFNSSTITPFTATDPSMLFAGEPGGAAPSVVPNIGTVNGLNGTDFQFQADANSSFRVVPEPMSIVLTGLGLVGMIGLLRARRRTAHAR